MNRLEVLGWSVLAQDALGIGPWEARMLARMALQVPGQIATHDDLLVLVVHPRDDGAGAANTRVPTRIAKLRNALVDIGFSRDTIETAFGEGYRIAPDVAELIAVVVLNPAAWEVAA